MRPGGSGNRSRVPGERVEAFEVVDVEPDHVSRNPTLAEVLRDEAHLGVRVIRVPALMVSKRPPRRQGHPTGERGVAIDHALGIGTVDEVVIELSAVGAEREPSLRLVTDVEVAAERVVEKDAVAAAAAEHEEERHRHVDRIGTEVVRERVAVPHRVVVAAQLASALVEVAGFRSQAVHLFIVTQPLPDTDGAAREGDPILRVVFVERVPLCIRN